MRLTFFLLLFGVNSFAVGLVPKQCIHQLAYRHFPPTEATYQEVISQIKLDRRSLLKNKVSIDSCKAYFLDAFEYDVFPHWVGTTWDYNGYTNVPGEGKLVACGYFVSTPLKHMGFNWNRFKLAQMYSKKIAETLCADVTKYTNQGEMISEINKRDNNLYIVGLDSHVGMILKSDSGTWFVHSNYYGNKGPDKEIAMLSQALDDSGTYYLGTFTTSENISKWLNGTLIPTTD
jgi:hypothetical protein